MVKVRSIFQIALRRGGLLDALHIHDDVFDWTITGGSRLSVDRVNDVQARDHLTENRVVHIQHGGSTDGFIDILLFVAEDKTRFSLTNVGLVLLKLHIVERLSLNDIELTAGTCFGWVHLIAHPRSSKGTLFMKILRIEFGRDSVSWSTHTEVSAWSSTTAIGVTALRHKILDAAMKEQTIVEALIHEH